MKRSKNVQDRHNRWYASQPVYSGTMSLPEQTSAPEDNKTLNHQPECSKTQVSITGQQNNQPSTRRQENTQQSSTRQQNTLPSTRRKQNTRLSTTGQQSTQSSARRQQNTQLSTTGQQNTHLSITSTITIPATSQSSSYGSLQHQYDLELHQPASLNAVHHANNYVIPAADSKERKDPWDISPCQSGLQNQELRICPQYNGRGCVTEPCRRLHVCFFWATKTCMKTYCNCYHSLDSMHNRRLIEACAMKSKLMLDNSKGTSLVPEELQICLFSVLKKCSKRGCSRVHSTKSYLWEVKDNSGWIQLSHKQNDYLELMYSHPSKEQVDLIPIETDIGNRNLQRLADLLSKETSWSVDLEAFKLNGTSVHEIRRLSTVSDLTSRVPVATRWVWYWQDDDGCWEPYLEGAQKKCYYVALSDHLEYILQAQNIRFVTIHIKEHSYTIDGKEMTQTNLTTGRTRRVRRRPAYTLVCKKSVMFDDLFLTQPTTKKYLKLPVVPLSSEFIFVESLLKQTLAGLKVANIQRIQNNHLWKVYQNKKRFLISLNNGDTMAINEQYLFHGTSHEAVDHICAENFNWRLCGTNVGHLYGQGTYFTNLAKLAHMYGKSNKTDKKVMLVVLVLVGKMTVGHVNMSFPPMNASTGRNYDTTCDKETNASIFVKYDRDEYYPAYIVKYSCAS
uniref:Poly [ADP-ribose] polymerase n=1 Tax=Scylla olivacea TaxID=85551 RepID=A0A0P4WFX8_SCYOL